METVTHRRPASVTFLSVLGVIQGLVAIALGIFVIADRNDTEFLRHINETDALADHQVTPDQLLTWGLIIVVAGALSALLAIALLNGSNFVRWLFGIGAVINVGGGLYGLIALHGEQRMTGAWGVVVGVVVLWILFGNREANEFFES